MANIQNIKEIEEKIGELQDLMGGDNNRLNL